MPLYSGCACHTFCRACATECCCFRLFSCRHQITCLLAYSLTYLPACSPRRDITLTPRQRIAVYKELFRLRQMENRTPEQQVRGGGTSGAGGWLECC